MIEATIVAPLPIGVAMMPSTMPTPTRIRKTTTSTPRTCQPLPLTSSRLRPKAPITPSPSTTIEGAPTAQIVTRKRPGMMKKKKPIPTAMPKRMPKPISGRM